MAAYRVHFVDHGGRVYAAQPLDCRHHEEAIGKARLMHARSIGAGFEIWHDDELIHVEKRLG